MDASLFETIKVEVKDRTGVISLNRPEVMNAVNIKMIGEINKVLDDWENDSDIRAIVLTAGERGFCAGGDLKESKTRTLKQQIFFLHSFSILITRFENLTKPVIAAVDGKALGGGMELILGCDFILATEASTFGLPEINVGVIPAAGGTQRLPRLIGRMKAKELILTGRSITAREAEKLGMLNKVVSDRAALVAEYTKLGGELAEKPPIAIMQDKRLINKGGDMPLELGLEYAHEAGTVVDVSQDRQEGLKAFAEKRKPQFKGE